MHIITQYSVSGFAAVGRYNPFIAAFTSIEERAWELAQFTIGIKSIKFNALGQSNGVPLGVVDFQFGRAVNTNFIGNLSAHDLTLPAMR